MTRDEIDALIAEVRTFKDSISFVALGGEDLQRLADFARLGASVAAPRDDEIERVAYALFREGFHKDDWGDGEGRKSVVAEKWKEWADERERMKRHALSALTALSNPEEQP